MPSTPAPPLRTVLLGLGGAAERLYLPAARQLDEIELVAAYDPDAERRAWGERRGVAVESESVEATVGRHRPDLVIVGSPPAAHRDSAVQALDLGAHVFLEKPFAETVEQCDEMLAAARRSRRLLVVNNQYRYMPIYADTRRRLEAGEFGRLYAVQCWQQMYHPPAHEAPPWRRVLRRAVLYEFGTHAVDLLVYLFGEAPETISARVAAPVPEFDADTLVQATLGFPSGGLATLWFNRVTRAPMRYLEMRADCEEASLRLSLGGVARASLEWAGRLMPRLSLAKGGEARAERDGRSRTYCRMASPAFAPATADHLRETVARIRRGDVDPASAERSRAVLDACLAGYRSSERAGATVRLPAVPKGEIPR